TTPSPALPTRGRVLPCAWVWIVPSAPNHTLPLVGRGGEGVRPKLSAQRSGKGRMGRSARRRFRSMLRPVVWLIAFLIAIPLVLTPIYAFVNPISVPMLQRQLTGRPVVSEWRPIDTISDRLKAAVVLSEDGQ